MNTTMNTGAASLLPCPFCGGADIQRGRAAIGERPTFHTYCNSCEAGTQGHPTREASDAAWNRRATPQADAAPIINGHAINDLFLKWSEWTTELGEAISRKNIDGFVSELRAAIAAGGAQEAVAMPAGWKLIRVNEHFDALIAALERAESKGYLPDAMADEWANFACDENTYAAPLPRVAATVAEGFALVPVVMTAAMINAWAGGRAVSSDEVAARTPFQDAWKRVLAAASNGGQ
jgi:Lar family restriction alleviation protein